MVPGTIRRSHAVSCPARRNVRKSPPATITGSATLRCRWETLRCRWDVVRIDRCLLLNEPTQALREAAGDAWHGADEVEIRTGVVGAAIVVHPGSEGLAPLPDADVAIALGSASRRLTALRGDPV
ncbi:MAG: hypothetical protein ACRDU8_06140, partial [Egibacteraceae bacterium]